MTLLIAAHNGRDMILGSDTLAKIIQDGKTRYETGHQKIIPMNKHTALMLDGNFDGVMLQYAKDYAYSNRSVRDVVMLRDNVLNSPSIPHLSEGQKIQFCFAGFTNKKPDVRVMTLEYGKQPRSGVLQGAHFVTGYEKPSRRAADIMDMKGLSQTKAIGNVKSIVTETLQQCIEEFKDSNNERLGGSPDIVLLRRS